MTIVILLLIILLPILLIRIILMLVKKTGSPMKIVLHSLAFVLALAMIVWFFTPFSVQIPSYDDAVVRVNHGDATVELDESQSAEIMDIIGGLSFQRDFPSKTPSHNNDDDYYYVTVTLMKNGETVFLNMYHLAKTPFRGGGQAYDRDMNIILNSDHFIDDIVSIVDANT
jgi:Tfp pilus assembly protein PilE